VAKAAGKVAGIRRISRRSAARAGRPQDALTRADRSARLGARPTGRQGGFQGEVKVTAGPAAIKGWTVSLAYPAGQTIQQGWNATVSASGSTVTAVNAGYNGALAAGASTTFGFIGSGASTVPAASCRAIV
jgi:cellulase/cellobiase CelA1